MINAKTCPYPGAFAQRFGLGDARAAQLTHVAARLRGRVCHRLGEVVRGAHQLRNPPLRTGKQDGSPGGIGDGRDRPQFAGRVGGRRLDAVEQAGHIANRVPRESATASALRPRRTASSRSRRSLATAPPAPGAWAATASPARWTIGVTARLAARTTTRTRTTTAPNSTARTARTASNHSIVRVRRSADPLMGIRISRLGE